MGKVTLIKRSLLVFSFIPLFYASINLVGEIPQSALKVMPPMNEIYHPVSTLNPEAQKSFDMGLTYKYAYNHDLAFRMFEKASVLDPNLAMAYWGMALVKGQNVNEDVTPEDEKLCYQYIQQALKLAPQASPSEQAYINALSTRYTNVPNADLVPLRYKYRDAMKNVVQQFPEDLDAATLYAESILNLDPWKWWTYDGKPNEGVLEAADVLEFALRRNPDHIGANHFYIHAWEESPYPERALMSADRLTYLLPESGHLLHMPCHIFLLVGDYERALKTNLKAIEQDREYVRKYGIDAGPYPLHYLKHNMYILVRTYVLMEDYDHAIEAALNLNQFLSPYYNSMAHLAYYSSIPLQVYLYFHKWQEILDYPMQVNAPVAQAYWHFSRSIAFAAKGNVAEAEKERGLMRQSKQQVNLTEEIANNPTSKIFELAEVSIEAAIAKAQHNIPVYISCLQDGVVIQDHLNYDEPPLWYVPIRLELGFALLRQGNAKASEQVFSQVLKNLQRNGRALFGLSMSLKAQGRDLEAFWVQREANAALKHASFSPLQFQRLAD